MRLTDIIRKTAIIGAAGLALTLATPTKAKADPIYDLHTIGGTTRYVQVGEPGNSLFKDNFDPIGANTGAFYSFDDLLDHDGVPYTNPLEPIGMFYLDDIPGEPDPMTYVGNLEYVGDIWGCEVIDPGLGLSLGDPLVLAIRKDDNTFLEFDAGEPILFNNQTVNVYDSAQATPEPGTLILGLTATALAGYFIKRKQEDE